MAAFTLRGLACIVIACFLLVAPTSKAALTCGSVISALTPCFPYVFGRQPMPSPACCGGVKNVYNAAQYQVDRQSVCNCLKGIAGRLPGVNYGLVASVPRNCGVSLPYAVAPSTDCNKIP